ncbi:tetratricopeptide repeat protein [Parabacteroides timonensis]|uniref:tetratricopeptide repeat protein n=1 Tax=Parabacteroides timonensis TaxID=1871013 RepID=UPI00094EC331|nr:sel1 repeat family protein [Parabacteroides timonensis]
MKNIFYLLFLLITFFTSCRNESTERQLINDAEALLEIKPDSAYLLLDSITMADNLSDKLLARWCMLYGKAADKVHEDMPYVSQLLRARTWYEKHGTPYEQAQIGLFLGRSYVEDSEYMKAMDAYAQALDIAERAKEYNVAGYICSYMGDLYELKGFFQETLDKYNQSADYFLKADNKRSYALALKFMAQTLAFEDSCSLALEYLLKADSIVVCLQDSGAISAISNGLGNIYGILGDTLKAETYLLKALDTDSLDSAPNFLALSSLYMDMGNLDKARWYLNKSRTIPIINQYTPISSLYLEHELEKRSNNSELALSILEQYVEKVDSIYNSTIHLDILDAEKRYNHVMLLNENNQLRITNLVDIIILILIVIICLILFIVYQYRSKLRNDKLYEQEIKLKQNDMKIYELSSELNRMKGELSLQGSLEHNEQILDKLKSNITEIQNELILLRREKLLSSPIVNKITKLSLKVIPGKGSPLSDKDWVSLKNVINQIYTSFSNFIINNDYGLSPAELQYCYLSFLELDIRAESILLNINPESVSKRRFRVRQKLGNIEKELSLYEYFVNI